MNEIVLSLFGELQIALNGEPISGIDSDKVRALFVFLAVEADQTHRRDALAEIFWPDKPEGDGRKNLRQSLANLRKSIGDRGSASPFLISSRDKVQFNAGSSCTIDIVEFQDLIKNTRDHNHEKLVSCNACSERLERAAKLYKGDFLEQFYLPNIPSFEEWVIRYRENLRRQMSEVLRGLISIQEKQNNLRAACEYARKLVTLEPWSEGNHRLLMRLLALSGNRSAALKQYHICQQILATELGVDPAKETSDLYEQIKEWELGIPSQSDLIAPLVDEAVPVLEPVSEALSKRPASIWIRRLLAVASVLAVGYALYYALNVRTPMELEPQEQPIGTERTIPTPTSSQAMPTQEASLHLPMAGDGYEVGELLFEDDFVDGFSHYWDFDGQPWTTKEMDGRNVFVAEFDRSSNGLLTVASRQNDYLLNIDFFLARPNADGYYMLAVSTRQERCTATLAGVSRYQLDLAPEGMRFFRETCSHEDEFEKVSSYSVSPEQWHSLQIINYQGLHQVFIDGDEVFNITLENPAIGMSNILDLFGSGSVTYIDDVQVYELKPDSEDNSGFITPEDGYEVGELLYKDDFESPLSVLWGGGGYGQDPWLTEEIDGRSVMVADWEQAEGIQGGDWSDYLAQFDFYLSKPSLEGYYSLHVSTRTYGCSVIEGRPNRYSLNLTPEGIHFDRNACDSDLYFSLDSPYSVSPKEWHTLQIFNFREKYRVVLDDVEIFNILIDPPVEWGGVQFELDFRGIEYYIDHFRIYELLPSEG